MKTTLVITALCVSLTCSIAQASKRAEQGWEWIEQGALIVDVRTPQEFADDHLNNAVNYPLSELEIGRASCRERVCMFV